MNDATPSPAGLIDRGLAVKFTNMFDF